MKGKLTVLFALALLVGMAFATSSGVNVTVGNEAPVIVSVATKTAEDPTSCTTTAIVAETFNVTDANGASDLDPASMYINYTNGGVTGRRIRDVPAALPRTSRDLDRYPASRRWRRRPA
jgi:hypothetical protein